MQLDPAQCKKRSVEELSVSERDTLADWASRFSVKYEVVGFLNDGANPRTLAGSNGGGRRGSAQESSGGAGGSSSDAAQPESGRGSADEKKAA